METDMRRYFYYFLARFMCKIYLYLVNFHVTENFKQKRRERYNEPPFWTYHTTVTTFVVFFMYLPTQLFLLLYFKANPNIISYSHMYL